MSEFYCHVVRVDTIEVHSNADNLEIIPVYSGYPCIVKKGQFTIGDTAVYISVDAMVPSTNVHFQFLWGADNSEASKWRQFKRIRAKRLRGVFSMGLLIPSEPQWEVGQFVAEELGIHKYEPDTPRLKFQSEYCEKNPGVTPVYDLEGYRKYTSYIAYGERVAITEKIHGTSAVYFYHNGTFYVGSHRTFPKRSENNVYWDIADKYELERICRYIEGIALYGEIFGTGVQKGFDYGASTPQFSVFDMFNFHADTWLDYYAVQSYCGFVSVPMVPTLAIGEFDMDMLQLAKGVTSVTGKDFTPTHIREGLVIENLDHPYHSHFGRVKLKYVSEDYLLHKNS